MLTQRRWNRGILIVLCGLALAPAIAQAQVFQRRQQPAQQPAQPQPGQAQPRTVLRPVQGQETLADRQIATWLILANEKEVAIADLARKHAKSDQVRNFADMSVKEHTNLISQLRPYAPNTPTLGTGQPRTGARSETDDATRQAQRQLAPAPQQRTAAGGQFAEQAGAQQGLPVDQICYQMAERGLESCRKELSRMEGARFDRAYTGGQIFEHMAMLNTLHILRQYASPQLQAVLDEATQPTEQHLAQARQLCEELSGDSSRQNETKTSRSERNDRGED